MLPEFGHNLQRLPRRLTFVRDIEAFEGTILSEFRAEGGGLYLEKWCSHDETTVRTLVVRTEQRAVAEYLARRMSMRHLLTGPSDDIGFIVDRVGDAISAVFLVHLSGLPPKYLPRFTAFHDETLRPEWDTTPQNFLLDKWDADLLATIEKQYMEVFSFGLLTMPNTDLSLPQSLYDIHYDGGYPIMHAFRHVRSAVPMEYRARTVGVSANSPGVLTIDAPTHAAKHLANAIYTLPRSTKAYDILHGWARLKPEYAERIDVPVAIADIRRLCEFLLVDFSKVLPLGREPTHRDVLTAGKLVAAYYRRLWDVLTPASGIEFIDVRVEEELYESPGMFDEDEDEDEV